MADHFDDSKRQMIPRWRPFQVASSLRELGETRRTEMASPPEPAPGELESLKRDWIRNRTLVHATNVIDAALVLERPEFGYEAAHWLLENSDASEISRQLAKQVLGLPPKEPEPNDRIVDSSARFAIIAGYRRKLRRVPRDPITWMDLALEYCSLGQYEPARRAVETSLALAGSNRFVLRGASRFYTHVGDLDRAHYVLARAAATKSDPWLLSAEIAAAELTPTASRWINLGIRLIESNQFAPHDISELASAIGTIHHSSGNRRKANRLIKLALEDPTENSVAQAGWLERHGHQSVTQLQRNPPPRAYEASAWVSVLKEDYLAALHLADQWLCDEPFSTKPALFGSWLASQALEDYSVAIRLLDKARGANPNHPAILTQLIYCKACLGELDEAENLIKQVRRSLRTRAKHPQVQVWEVLLTADQGLIEYRRGNTEQGERWYQEALETARKLEDRALEASAIIHHARERVRALPEMAIDRDELYGAVSKFRPGVRGVMRHFVDRITQSNLRPSLT